MPCPHPGRGEVLPARARPCRLTPPPPPNCFWTVVLGAGQATAAAAVDLRTSVPTLTASPARWYTGSGPPTPRSALRRRGEGRPPHPPPPDTRPTRPSAAGPTTARADTPDYWARSVSWAGSPYPDSETRDAGAGRPDGAVMSRTCRPSSAGGRASGDHSKASRPGPAWPIRPRPRVHCLGPEGGERRPPLGRVGPRRI